MKKSIIFCLFIAAFCFCNQKKNIADNAEETTNKGQNVSAQDISKETADNIRETLSIKSDTDTILSKWVSDVGGYVLSELRKAFGGDDNETIASANAVLQKHVSLVGNSWASADHDDDGDISFRIQYTDNNYISSTFSGTVFTGAHPSSFIWSIMVDIKNKRRLTLKDIVKINGQFIKVVFNKVEDINKYLDDDESYSYSMDELQEALLDTDVEYEDKYTPSNTSYFDEKNLFISLSHVPSSSIILPLNEIRTMIILPNFPTGSQ
jgi:hypothetical protein